MMASFLKTYSLITCGGIIQGIAMAVFLFPHSIPSGGAGGIAVLLHYWFNTPLGFGLWLVNFSCLVAAVKWLGNASTLGTMFGITVNSLTIYVVSVDMHRSSELLWLDLIVGSLLLGAGVGILLRQGVSNGGMGVLALIIANYRNILPGKPLFAINGSIFLFTGFIIDCRLVFLAIMSQWLCSKVVNFVCHIEIAPSTNLAFRKGKK